MGRPKSSNPTRTITIGIKVKQQTLIRWQQAWNLYRSSKRNSTREDFLNHLLNSILIHEEDLRKMRTSIVQAKISELTEEVKKLIGLFIEE